jgi:hypothetical protein
MIELNLNNQKLVTVNAFTLDFTYGGLLTYQTSEGINRKLFERANYPSNWGNRKVLKLKPKEIDFKTILEPCYYCVWLKSDSINDQNADGSELVVIWFDDIPTKKSIEKIIDKGIRHIDWEDNAENFKF